MKKGKIALTGERGPINIERNEHGVAHITAVTLEDVFVGLGYCHARDRGLQLLLQRTLGRGEACEKLQDNEELLKLDCFFRRWNFGADAPREEAALSASSRAAVDAYCRGINEYFYTAPVPWELRLLGCRFEDWTVADVFLVGKLAGFIGLAQTQGDIERFIVECIQHGISGKQLEELFPGQLTGLDEALVRRVKLHERLVPESVQWASALPALVASNNWAVAGSKSASGKPLFCNDPHLEVNRLPPVWYEAVIRWTTADGPRYAMGGTLPGVPAIVFGRTPELAWGVTNAFMDSIDSWIEDCREGQFRRADVWVPFRVRNEVIRRKKHPPLELAFYENDHGVLEGDPHDAGLCLATRWSSNEGTGAGNLAGSCGILSAHDVEQARRCIVQICNGGWNWVLADRAGNIAYQMSGKMPRRRTGTTGLVPLPGWDPANDWSGFERWENLPQALNPIEAFVATANEDLNRFGVVHPISVAMGPSRAQRIRNVLSKGAHLTVEDMKRLQYDLYSCHAERFMAVFRPLLSEFLSTYKEATSALAEWDLKYNPESTGAFVFEQVYRALTSEVFGGNGGSFGHAVLGHLRDETCLFCDFYAPFERVLLSKESAWFGGRTQEAIIRAALGKGLQQPVKTYGHGRTLRMQHLLFGGKLPLVCGFDRLIELRGSRGTIHQGQIYRTAGRTTSFAPSAHLVTDLATDEIHTNLPGGPSDRRFSSWYASNLADWLSGRYKLLRGYPSQKVPAG